MTIILLLFGVALIKCDPIDQPNPINRPESATVKPSSVLNSQQLHKIGTEDPLGRQLVEMYLSQVKEIRKLKDLVDVLREQLTESSENHHSNSEWKEQLKADLELTSEERCLLLDRYTNHKHTVFENIDDDSTRECVADILANASSSCGVFFSIDDKITTANEQLDTKYSMATRMLGCYFPELISCRRSTYDEMLKCICSIPNPNQISFHSLVFDVELICCYSYMQNTSYTSLASRTKMALSKKLSLARSSVDNKLGLLYNTTQNIFSEICRFSVVFHFLISQTLIIPACYDSSFYNFEFFFLSILCVAAVVYSYKNNRFEPVHTFLVLCIVEFSISYLKEELHVSNQAEHFLIIFFRYQLCISFFFNISIIELIYLYLREMFKFFPWICRKMYEHYISRVIKPGSDQTAVQVEDDEESDSGPSSSSNTRKKKKRRGKVAIQTSTKRTTWNSWFSEQE